MIPRFLQPCTVIDDTTMTCPTPNLMEGLDVETFKETSSENPASSYPGHNTVNCTIVDAARGATEPNSTAETRTFAIVKGPSECLALLRNSSDAGSETQSKRRKRREIDESEESESATEPLNNSELQFYIGFQFDGDNTYTNFTSLPVYQDPEYYKFEEKDYIRLFDPERPHLHIKVSDSQAASTKDPTQGSCGQTPKKSTWQQSWLRPTGLPPSLEDLRTVQNPQKELGLRVPGTKTR